MVWEGIPEALSGQAECPIPQGAELGPGSVEEQATAWPEVGVMKEEQFFEIRSGIVMKTLESLQEAFEFNLEWEREPVQRCQEGGDVMVFPHSHQDPGNQFGLSALLKGTSTYFSTKSA